MSTPAFDRVAYKETTRKQCQEAAEAWDRWGDVIDRWLGPATEVMLDMAGIGKGSRVLDVAAGAGGQSLTAARRAGDGGSVLATDISSNLLDFTARRAREAGLSNLDTAVVDGEQLDVEEGSFDAVISRVGFQRAGVTDVETRRMGAPLQLSSAAECLRFQQESFGALQQMLAGLSDEDRAEAWREIEMELGRFEGPNGLEGPCELLIAAGTR